MFILPVTLARDNYRKGIGNFTFERVSSSFAGSKDLGGGLKYLTIINWHFKIFFVQSEN